jgi:hypothetical protein
MRIDRLLIEQEVATQTSMNKRIPSGVVSENVRRLTRSARHAQASRIRPRGQRRALEVRERSTAARASLSLISRDREQVYVRFP